MDNGEMLATIALGEAFEATNLRTYICRSSDNGETWQLQGEIYPGTKKRLTSDCSRLTYLSDGKLVAFMVRHDRSDHPNKGLTNSKTLGFVPTELLLLHSDDYGHTWTEPQPFTAPLKGPSFELCSPITVLKDGRWVLPTQTWPGWDGYCPNGVRMVALVSNDRGQNWPHYWNVMREPGGRVYFWETKMVELSDGRLLTTAWGYDDIKAKDLPNQFVVSQDKGETWSKPASTNLYGQTLTPCLLENDMILSIYRRVDKQGLWANISRLDGRKWVNLYDHPLWGQSRTGLISQTDNMSENFTKLRFGAPCITRLKDGTYFIAFWCFEDIGYVIRWFKIEVTV